MSYDDRPFGVPAKEFAEAVRRAVQAGWSWEVAVTREWMLARWPSVGRVMFERMRRAG